MINHDISQILIRDLNKLKEELNLYPDNQSMWKVIPGTSNTGGNLSLHLAGNLRHFIGAVLGNTGYIRERDLEFSTKDVELKELISQIDITISEVNNALENLDPAVLSQEFPKEIGGMKRDTGFVLLHLMSHLSYHLGQINYHRRIVTSLKM